jgi:hypothetical protein
MITIYCDFPQFSAKMPFSSKPIVMIKFLYNLALFRVKNAKIFANFWGENIQGDQIGRIFAQYVGDCLLWAVLLKLRKYLAPILGYIFPGFALIMTKMRWATFWSIFCTNSSGHPENIFKIITSVP